MATAPHDHASVPSRVESFAPAGVFLLLRMKYRATSNHVRELVDEAPIKVLVTGLFIGLIWLALYGLFAGVFEYFQTNLLQSVIAIPLVFNFFFVALLALLTFSNAILVYGALFTGDEAHYLLSSPLHPLSTVALKYGESLVFSSWSLILLGLPLMMAIARVQGESWIFYPMFIAFFLAFVPIPGAIGLLVAWIVARFLPGSVRRVLAYGAILALVAVVAWSLRSVRAVQDLTGDWMKGFFTRLSLIEASILPSTWVTRGIEAALNDQTADATRYLVVVIANALFLSWAAVHLVAGGLVKAHDRVGSSSGTSGAWSRRNAVAASGGFAGRLFFFLPHHARLIAAKDLRTFVRDPMQWSQLAILFGLMALYLANMPRFDIDETSGRWAVVVPFLNLTAVSFILATFTSRFVFPMISLEGHQLWLIGLFPIRRAWILVAKFSFAFTVTFGVAACVMTLASYILRISGMAAVLNLLVTASVCYGLCGFAVGIGARLPMFSQTNPARIANGLGGTINLIASVTLIAVMLSGVAYITYKVGEEGFDYTTDLHLMLVFAAVVSVGLIAGTWAMVIGARHFDRIET